MRDSGLRKDVALIVIVIAASLTASALTVFILTANSIKAQKEDILGYRADTATIVAGRFELRIEDAIKVLQIGSKSEAFDRLDAIDKVSEEFMGIPEAEEPAKKRVAQNILSEFKHFETVSFVLPNGDIYFVEPHKNQLELPRLNFADREWYQGALETGQGYAADPIVSAATGNKVVPIAVPLFEQDGTPRGMIVAGLNLETFRQQLISELALEGEERAIIFGDNAAVVVDIHAGDTSGDDNVAPGIPPEAFAAIDEIMSGRAGVLTEQIGGTEMLAVYQPIVIGTEEWSVVLVQSTKSAFYDLDLLWYQAYIMLAIISLISATSGYLLIRFRVRSALVMALATANTELKEKDKMKAEFLKIASHELKTPIQPIIGFSSLGAQGLIKDNQAWKIVNNEARRLMKLSNNIFDICMAQSGELMYDMKKTSIVELVHSAVETFRPIAAEKNLSLNFKVDESCKTVDLDADASRLRRVFTEMLDNAIKFTDKGGIMVECKIKGESLSITFSDTGTPIPAEILPRLFEMFASQSVSDATTQGSGLGLFISKLIVKAHGGTLVARNNAPEPETVFEITLPLYSRKELSPKTTDALLFPA